MKTLTIPKRFGYPTLDITVNGIEYTVKSGEEITLEDHVAEAIENAIALAPKLGVPRNRFAQHIEGIITDLTSSDFDGVETIAYYALAYSKKLKTMEIPSGIKVIAEGAFYGCSALESVKFGENSDLVSIGTVAFGYCKALSAVFLPEKPPALVNVDAFTNIQANCTFYCKTQESLDAYKAATNWSTLTGTYSFVVE